MGLENKEDTMPKMDCLWDKVQDVFWPEVKIRTTEEAIHGAVKAATRFCRDVPIGDVQDSVRVRPKARLRR